MHEVTLANDLIQTAEAAVARAGARGRVRSLRVRVGGLSCASGESLRTCFELVRAGTRLEQARLDIEQDPATCVCIDCGTRSPAESLLAACPACGSVHVRFEGGEDVLLVGIDVDEEDPARRRPPDERRLRCEYSWLRNSWRQIPNWPRRTACGWTRPASRA